MHYKLLLKVVITNCFNNNQSESGEKKQRLTWNQNLLMPSDPLNWYASLPLLSNNVFALS